MKSNRKPRGAARLTAHLAEERLKASEHSKSTGYAAHANPDEPDAKREFCKWNGDTTVRIPDEIAVKIPEDFLAKYETGQQENAVHNKKTRLIGWLGLIAVVIYASLTAFQWWQAKSAADNSVRFFRIDERAWMEFGQIDTINTTGLHTQLKTFKYRIFPKNVGKTVARGVQIHLEITFGQRIFSDNKFAIEHLEDQDLLNTEKNFRWSPQTIAPEELSVVPIDATGAEPTPPQQVGRSLVSDPRYTYILGRMDYKDSFGAAHWMRFCYVIANNNGELDYCHYGNDEDQNPEPEP